MKHTSPDALVFILLGQSNATGHALPMREEDCIREPLSHVFGLSRRENQSLSLTHLHWSGYTGDMNLAEAQDHTYSLANCLARLWQDAWNAGEPLPPLYIVQIAIGAEGVTEKYMWYPHRPPKLFPGELGTADISLYPFTRQVFSLLDDSFRRMNKSYEILGIHWRGGEEETDVPVEILETCLRGIYDEIWTGFYQSLGHRPPIILHTMACPERTLEMDPTGEGLKSMHFINRTFARLAEENENISLFDIRTAPFYREDIRTHGIFLADATHYTEEANRWTAQQILLQYKKQCSEKT